MTQEHVTADVLRLLDTSLDQTQVERVARLLALGSPEAVAAENGTQLSGSQEAYTNYLQQVEKRGFRYTNILDPQYPHLLREVREAPGVIYTEGELQPEEVGVSIVGSRDTSPEALDAAFQLAGALAAHGIPVISGLARGIDTAAHMGALESGGRTVAVVGTGLDVTYPPENADLRNRIVSAGGLILSQFRIGAELQPRNFPMRNAVMSGYGTATIVMAASEKSGTRHQVQAAVKHGRPVIFTGKVANEVSWAREIMAKSQGTSVRSLEEAVEVALETRRTRTVELSLF